MTLPPRAEPRVPPVGGKPGGGVVSTRRHAAVVVLGVVVIGLGFWRLKEARRAVSQSGPASYGDVPEFSLTERSGRVVRRADLLGKVWVADFIFTRCSGPCPVLSARMGEMQKSFTDPGVRFVSFSVDPGYDTPEVLSRYAQVHGAHPDRWLFLTGRTEEARRVVFEGFHLAMENDPDAAPGESVNHSLHFVLVGRDAQIRGYYNGTDRGSLERLRRDLRGLL